MANVYAERIAETMWAFYYHFLPTKEPPIAAMMTKQYIPERTVARLAATSLVLSICAMVM